MLSSSALVLTALTISGFYVRNHTQKSLDNGYSIDFSALENRADDKLKEIAKSSNRDRENIVAKDEETLTVPPLEAGSDDVKIPGLTEGKNGAGGILDQSGKSGTGGTVDQSGKKGTGSAVAQSGKGATGSVVDQSVSKGMSDGAGKKDQALEENATQSTAQPVQQAEAEEEQEVLPIVTTAGQSPVITEDLHFEANTMVRPVSGDTLIDYSMDKSVYFATLDQYKYNPAEIYAATQGETVVACTAGRVINVHNDAELGHVVVLDLGDGYQAIYGQVENIEVPIGGTVGAGMKLATVAAPTKYYSKEGCNLYFQIKKDGESVDPGNYFK